MNRAIPITFHITIHSTEQATWQGVIVCEDEHREFESELQLLQHMMELAPPLSPERRW